MMGSGLGTLQSRSSIHRHHALNAFSTLINEERIDLNRLEIVGEVVGE